MNNFNNLEQIDEINSQLERAEIQKKRLIINIYKEYEQYLNLVRKLLYISVEKGLNQLHNYSSNKEIFLNANELICFFEKKISKLIYKKLPLITVEQLKIKKIKNINKVIDLNSFGGPKKIMDNLTEKFENEDISQCEEPVQFQITEDISSTSEYYLTETDDKLLSLDLDNNNHIYYSSKNNIIENIGEDKQFISSLLELIEEVKVEEPRYSEKQNINKQDISSKNQSLNNFDLIDESLENLLLNLSYDVNLELFKANLIKKMISKDSFEYLVGKKLMLNYPHPFVINFKFNINHPSSIGKKLPSISFLNISTVELEFKNLNLSIQRNKINELKNQFHRFIKKERYWRQKEITLNNIH